MTPNPGSNEAIKAGCLCPVMDNAHGRGYRGEGQFLYVEDCPLHAEQVASIKAKKPS